MIVLLSTTLVMNTVTFLNFFSVTGGLCFGVMTDGHQLPLAVPLMTGCPEMLSLACQG